MPLALRTRLHCLHILFLACLVTAQSSTYWVANIDRKGHPPFGDSTYPVFRNVQSYGARGDGVTDDTAAIQQAMALPGTRCAGGDAQALSHCGSQTTTPAILYFPPGTYIVSAPIIMYYFTQMVGDALNPPTIKASSSFTLPATGGQALFDTDVYIPGGGGHEWYDATNNFYRQLRNFVFDLTQAPNSTAAVHWQVGQATSVQNVVINMVPNPTVSAPASQQTGIYMENGSGGFMSDITINGGAVAAFLGNQQFTIRNMIVNGAGTAIYMNFDWIWTFTQLTITNCYIGIDMTNGGFSNQKIGSVVVFDSEISATYGIVTPYTAGFSSPQAAGSLMLENVDFSNSNLAVAVFASSQARIILAGGQNVPLFAQGNAWTTASQALNDQAVNGTTCVYANSTQTANTAQETTIQQQLAPVTRPSNLVDDNGRYFSRSKPQYEQYDASQFLSAKSYGLVGDGSTDDTNKMQAFLNTARSSGKIAYFDHGAYIVSSTIQVPTDLNITGECYAMIMATGTFFSDQTHPQPVWKIGNPGDTGRVEISDLVFETKGPVPGAIMVEWNIKAASAGAAGMWDTHWRIGGSAGTNLQSNTCLKQPGVTTTAASTEPCQGSSLLLHVTPQANGYFENTWGWVADHELDLGNRDQIDIYNGRGALIQSSQGPVWMYGTAFEHSSLYDYSFANAANVYAGHIQHETAYYQGNPDALTPFTPNPAYTDPDFADCSSGGSANCARTWGLRVVNSSNIYIYSAGLYNFFDNWDQSSCLDDESCQLRMVDVRNSSDVYLWALSTKGSSYLVAYEGNDVVPEAVNKANFCETVVLFEVASD